MMMMIGQLNASHTGVSGGPNAVDRAQQTRYPGFDLVADASGLFKVGHVYTDGPADHEWPGQQVDPGGVDARGQVPHPVRQRRQRGDARRSSMRAFRISLAD